ncbi:7,8-didemethyl-8-hydroxy-5-deazariboflavin synthase subunit CofH [Halodesulfurarchaeum sp.]|uniref:7,8-didemethyl-8-hydroxy-5-deazariboflavin synthase subunit CofH n=1 Tax=Halodesulfurarchaeum sp. TaxID=1980530 RepID=UPI002FC34B89
MADAFRTQTGVPRGQYNFERQPETDQSFENALEKARAGHRLSVADGIELMTTGSETAGISQQRMGRVVKAADERRREVVGEEVTIVANLNNNVTSACGTGCLFCNYRDNAHTFESGTKEESRGFTKTPAESRAIVADAVDRGISEVTSVSGLHPALTLDENHREIIEDEIAVNYKPPAAYTKSPGTYTEQIQAMSMEGVHVHSMTPEEADHAARGTEWDYETVYRRLKEAGLDSVPGTAAEILVDEVRDVICPGKIDTATWFEAMEGAAAAGLPMTGTIMYGHVENEAHRVLHLKRIRDLQDRMGAMTEFVPLSFIHEDTPLVERDMVDAGATPAEDTLMIAVSRLFLDNIDHIQSSWVKFGNERGLDMLEAGADDFMGTILSEEITKRAGGGNGEFRSFADLTSLIESIDRIPVERSTDYDIRRRIDSANGRPGPGLGPKADLTPLLNRDGEETEPAILGD